MSSHAPKPTPTVAAVKKAFVAAQANILAQAPTPSAAWHAGNDASPQPLPGRAVDEAVAALGQLVQQHCRRVYAPQATRNVAEQIWNVYVRDADASMEAQAEVERAGVARDIDLLDDDAIEALPGSWPSQRHAEAHAMEAKRYRETVARLRQLRDERRELRRRVDMLGRLKTLTDMLHTSHVQENLITRNGPVEHELERMRILLARVAGRVAELPEAAAPETAPEAAPEAAGLDLHLLATADKTRVDRFLANPGLFPS
ncbi:hypothetical protein CDD82_7368 [Ophiocordyceps australis]|uniref:Kinetochore protein fta4 n=1 Tax=Ophiocordyceps australis TaxID=1399860 RepID=A0A2C5ZQ91_9HYPO|nr:hypothetical protein CDD82_7368 [Ophiocordyceps australis]